MEDSWETLHRWEWFRREQWRPGFREAKAGKRGGSCGAFRQILASMNGKAALDASCGLGLKTIVLKEMGIDVDAHHLFLIEENGEQHLESATIRQPAYWTRRALEDAFAEAGFSGLETRRFPRMGRGGTDLALNVGVKRGAGGP